ncbi:MAG: biotin--[acetyl-CoA-carboxylase] ligase [Bacteroidota bacterium]
MKFYLKHFDRLPSTNSYAMELLENRAAEGTVIWADEQYAGRGQKGNAWKVEPGLNLTFSLILHPDLALNKLYAISKVAALALHDTIVAHLPPVQVWIKWPNDLLIYHRKVAGILIENQLEGSRLRSSVMGMGLNLNQRSWPEDLQAKATSLAEWSRERLDPRAVLFELLESIERYYALVQAGQFQALDQAYLGHLYGYQREVKVWIDEKLTAAQLLGVEPSGRLVLSIEGKQRSFDVKELSFELNEN